MKSSSVRGIRILGLGFLSLIMGPVFGQDAPPAELHLKAKIRDFVEDNPTKTPVHPHFYGTKDHQNGCSSLDARVNIVQAEIDTTDEIGDTAVFKGDNRGPRLMAPLDPKVAGCFSPVARFSDWYNDRLTGDVNRTFLMDMRFVRDTVSGVYQYFNDDFFPLDNGKVFTQLSGKPPFGYLLPAPNNSHNFGFTVEFHATFTYFKGRGQNFAFRGDDDVWVFINGKRVIDLGGIHPAQDASFNLDSVAAVVGLRDSASYPLDFFFAERHTITSKLRITTTLELQPVLAKPAITPGRSFEGQVAVTVSHPTPGAILYFTLDGSVPTAASTKYTGPITLSATATVKAIAMLPGWRNSEVAEETFTKMEQVAKPQADPASKAFEDSVEVSLAVATPGAAIRFTVDGSEPTAASPLYNGTLTFSASTTLKAKAFLAGWVPSEVMTELYSDVRTLLPPVADPPGKSFVGSQTVTLSVPGRPGSEIRYTLDGSEPTAASPRYSAPLTLDNTTVLKARNFEAGREPSLTMVEEYHRLAKVVRAVYVDQDGDGRIDGAVLRLDLSPAGLPAAIRLTDPFAQAALDLTSGAISKGAAGDILTVSFPDKPFSLGTAFPTGPFGAFPAAPGFDAAPFAVVDSVGPVPVKAVAINKASPLDNPAVEVTFSEPVDPAAVQAGDQWPFDILRNGGVLGNPVRVSSVVPAPGKPNTYRWTFKPDSPAYPVYIDSLTLAAQPVLGDLLGNPGIPGGKRIRVEGSPETVFNTILIQVRNAIEPRNQNDFREVPEAIRKDPFAVVVGNPGSPETCLNCDREGGSVFTSGRAMPEWVIKARYAFHYAFTIYDHLGNYVGKTSGQVTEDMIAKAALDGDGFRSLRFRWAPVAHNGGAVATGAYILKGILLNRPNEAQKGVQGEQQFVRQTETAVFATFGYLRGR